LIGVAGSRIKKGRPEAAFQMDRLRLFYQTAEAATRARRVAAKPRPAKPTSIIAQVDASGTALPTAVTE
jgi:hypothetical protein